MAMPSAAATEKQVSSQLQGRVSGVVIDSNKRPVPGATVTVAKQQVVTDDSGLFALKPTDTVMNVEIQSVGFVTRNAIVKDDAVPDTIVLRPSPSSLEEVVVAGYGTKKNARAPMRQWENLSLKSYALQNLIFLTQGLRYYKEQVSGMEKCINILLRAKKFLCMLQSPLSAAGNNMLWAA